MMSEVGRSGVRSRRIAFHSSGQIQGLGRRLRMNGLSSKKRSGNRKGFSLIELVIVVVIIAIIGAIAIPKMSRGAQGAGDSALIQDLAVLRSAVDLYNTEHPSATLSTAGADITLALTYYSDANGNTNVSKSSVYI